LGEAGSFVAEERCGAVGADHEAQQAGVCHQLVMVPLDDKPGVGDLAQTFSAAVVHGCSQKVTEDHGVLPGCGR
jgi:hypothetical protein